MIIRKTKTENQKTETKSNFQTMKVIILAAGKSTRLKNITKNIPKPMLKVKNEIVLEHNILWLKKYGIQDVYINLHYLPEIIKNYFGNGKKWNIAINYSYEKKILGTAGGVRKIFEQWLIENRKTKNEKRKTENKNRKTISDLRIPISDFIVIYGDSFYPNAYNLKKFIEFHKKKNSIATIGFYHKKSEVRKSGIAILDRDKRIKNFIEKPDLKQIKSDLVNTGIYAFDSKIIDYLPKRFSDFGKDVFPKILKKNIPLYGYVFKQNLIPIDTPKLYRRAQAMHCKP